VASRIDVQEAFRRGIRGRALQPEADGLAEDSAAFAAGANEQALLELTRLPGLTDPYAAFETGRALRRIVELFDRAQAPERIGREFLANLAGAVVVDHMRGSRRPWGAVETVDMFVELYARVLGDRPTELDALRRAVMDYAVSGQAGRASAKREPWYRRGAG
jgi:hypothetical protein